MVRKVEVLPYNPAWPEIYQNEACRLRSVMRECLIALFNIGSTSVPGLPAKPTIDILAVVRSHTHLDACNLVLEGFGYQCKGENGVKGRRYFQMLEGEVHLFHIHAYEAGHPDIDRHLNFRDYLCAHPGEARAYAELKQVLAERFTCEAKRYTAGKSDFIRTVDCRAAAWRKAHPAPPIRIDYD